MGKLATKQKVTLTLNRDIYRRTRELLTKLPGVPSVSSVVDQLLDQFVTTMGPIIDDVFSTDPDTQISALTRLYGDMALDLAGAIRAVQASSEKQKEGT
jgi:hypothetical protein